VLAQNTGKEPDTERRVRIETAVTALAFRVFNLALFRNIVAEI